MGLEQYIIAFVTFVNNLVIPFLLGIAFLIFVVNVFRFFIVGGANAESKEKARSLAVYGVLAFVLIMIFWGIIGLLTSSLGLQALGGRTPRCFDYECGPTASEQTSGGANASEQTSAGGNFGTGVDDSGSIGQSLGDGQDFVPVGGQLPGAEESGPDTTPGSQQPAQPNTPAGVTEFTAYIGTENVIRPVADNFIRTDAPDLFGRHTGAITDDLFADLPNTNRDPDNFSDVDRVQASMRLAVVGAISNDASLQYQTQLESYYEAVSPGYYQDNIGSYIDTISKDVPPAVQSNFTQTLSLIENELTAYYGSVGSGLTSSEAAQSVANDIQTLSIGSVDDRFAALENLYDQNILRDFDNTIYDQFSEDLNVQNIYAGNNPHF